MQEGSGDSTHIVVLITLDGQLKVELLVVPDVQLNLELLIILEDNKVMELKVELLILLVGQVDPS